MKTRQKVSELSNVRISGVKYSDCYCLFICGGNIQISTTHNVSKIDKKLRLSGNVNGSTRSFCSVFKWFGFWILDPIQNMRTKLFLTICNPGMNRSQIPTVFRSCLYFVSSKTWSQGPDTDLRIPTLVRRKSRRHFVPGRKRIWRGSERSRSYGKSPFH